LSEAVKLKDAAARRQIAEDLDRCLLVEAGAGSGKTASLVARMVALIKEGKCEISTMAALTFTRQAAAEMKGRLREALEKARAAESDEVKQERLNRALQGIDNCYIGTIHAFCGQLLRERPVEAGLEPGFVEMDELEDRLLRLETWREYLIATSEVNPRAIESLREIDIDMRELKDLHDTLCLYPEVEPIREEVSFPDLAEARAKLEVLLELAAEHWPSAVPSKGWDVLQKIMLQVNQRREFLGTDDDLEFLRVLEIMNKRGEIVQNRWKTPGGAKEVKAAYDGFQEEYVKPILKAWWEYRHARVIDFVLPAVAKCRERRVQAARLNYQDLLVITLEMLKHNSEVRSYFQTRYTHLLVDEFQDTDPLQAEILFYLTGDDTSEPDWRKLSPRPGSLFVVGDPKQSIYRFRRADIDTYNEVRQLIERSGGEVLHLTSNFRSVERIGDWVNRTFADLMGETDQFQPEFHRLDTMRVSAPGDRCGVHTITIPKVDRHRQEEIARQDAERIARWIRWALDGGITLTRTGEGRNGRPQPGDFMILFRYKSHIPFYARALEQYGIPFTMSGGDGLSDAEELSWLITLLRALLDPENPVSLLAVLRGPLFGFSDNQLLRFRRAGGKFSFQDPLPDGLMPEDAGRYDYAFATLRRFRGYLTDLPASAALRRIMVESGLLPCAAMGELGQSRAGYLLQALELMAAAERSGRVSPSKLLQYLETLRIQGVEEDITLSPGRNDAVRLMNLHKAKGLEASVVFLADPGKSVNCEPSFHINRQEGRPVGYYVVQKKDFFTYKTLGLPLRWEEHLKKEQQYTAAEELRLLYVAATRARNLLVISRYEGKPSNSPWFALEEHCAGLPELEDTAVDLDAEAASTIDLQMAELKTAQSRFLTANAAVMTPSYSVTSVTRMVKDASTPPTAEKGGKGSEWGSIIHRMLATLSADSGSDLELLVVSSLAEAERSPDEKDEALELLRGMVGSQLWQRCCRSTRRFMEIPFSTSVRDETAGLAPGTVVNGIIDLVFEEDGSWVIADYKTDAIGSPRKLQELTAYYAPQVSLYRQFWESLTGQKVKEAGLYFTSVGEWVEV